MLAHVAAQSGVRANDAVPNYTPTSCPSVRPSLCRISSACCCCCCCGHRRGVVKAKRSNSFWSLSPASLVRAVFVLTRRNVADTSRLTRRQISQVARGQTPPAAAVVFLRVRRRASLYYFRLDTLRGKKVFTRSAITPPKVYRFRRDLEQCEPNVGLALADFWRDSRIGDSLRRSFLKKTQKLLTEFPGLATSGRHNSAMITNAEHSRPNGPGT